jgi:hypothetical protein
MTITDSQIDRRVGLRLEFLKPLKVTNEGEFKFGPVPEGVRVTWSMSGTRNFVAKLFAFFVDIERMVGGDFEKGLAALRSLVETQPRAQ